MTVVGEIKNRGGRDAQENAASKIWIQEVSKSFPLESTSSFEAGHSENWNARKKQEPRTSSENACAERIRFREAIGRVINRCDEEAADVDYCGDRCDGFRHTLPSGTH